MTTGIIWDQRYLAHDTGAYHPERPERLQAIGEMLQRSAVGQQVEYIEPRMATHDEVALIHSLDHIRKIEETKGLTIQLDPDTVASPKSYDVALLAVGGLLAAVDRVVGAGPRARPNQGIHGGMPLRNAFAFVRPPGHHAEVERAMGFCLFNNVAIAAEYARKQHGLERVFIIDYDVHHGNGTQWAFYERPDIFYCSIHRYPFYPGTGAAHEEGKGKGRGMTRNFPMSAGEGDVEYNTVFTKEILPLAKSYNPHLILLSAGYDAHERDPLGGMNVSAAGFARMTAGLLQVAEETCGGKLVAVLEGGYDLQGLADSVEACLKEMVKKSS
jgi:acetoin utilization deacetylase AcuC-like enzyme